MITVSMFIRPDCPACVQAREDLEALQAVVPHQLVLLDVENSPELKGNFREQTPLVQVGPYTLRTPFTRQDLQVALSAAQQRNAHLEEVGDERYVKRRTRGQTVTGTDRFSYWLSSHYMWIFNLVALLYVGLPFLAPVLMKVGATLPARAIYAVYSPLCHQLGFRSFYLFGEQLYYPRELAHLHVPLTYEAATGSPALDLPEARTFKGNEQMGYKIALCQRDLAIYGSILLFGLVFSLTRRRIKAIPWFVWIIFGLIPIGLDGGSQLLGMLSFMENIFPMRESTPLLRLLTGGLFGTLTAWFLYPLIEDTMRDTRNVLARKLAAAKQAVPKRED